MSEPLHRVMLSCGCRKMHVKAADKIRCLNHDTGFPFRRQRWLDGTAAVERWDGKEWAACDEAVWDPVACVTEWSHLRFDHGGSNKFWKISPFDATGDGSGRCHVVNFGRIGTAGQIRWKCFSTRAQMLSDVERMIRSKLNKGYTAVGTISLESCTDFEMFHINSPGGTIPPKGATGTLSGTLDPEDLGKLLEGTISSRLSATVNAAMECGLGFEQLMKSQAELESVFESFKERIGSCSACSASISEGDTHAREKTGGALLCAECSLGEGEMKPESEIPDDGPEGSGIAAGRFRTLEIDEDA